MQDLFDKDTADPGYRQQEGRLPVKEPPFCVYDPADHTRTGVSVAPVPLRITAVMFFPVLMLVFMDLVAFGRVVMALNDHIATRLDGAVTMMVTIVTSVISTVTIVTV